MALATHQVTSLAQTHTGHRLLRTCQTELPQMMQCSSHTSRTPRPVHVHVSFQIRVLDRHRSPFHLIRCLQVPQAEPCIPTPSMPPEPDVSAFSHLPHDFEDNLVAQIRNLDRSDTRFVGVQTRSLASQS